MITVPVKAQTWSAQDQELIEHIEACWQADDDGAHEEWVRVCNPAPDMVLWLGGDSVPVTNLRYTEMTEVDWHQRYKRIAWDVRPINIRFYGDVAAVYYFWTQQLLENDGSLVNLQGRTLELHRKVDERWQYLGGMGAPAGEN